MQYAKPKVYWLMLIGVIFSILNTSTSYAAPTCPSGDKMYYVGASTPSGSTSLALSWTDGSTNKTFAFADGTGTTMTINFPLLVDPNSNYGGTPPFYGNITNATQNALNLVHNSPAVKDNHTMTISVNRAVTKLSFVVQDLDSFLNTSNQVPYQERVDVSSTSGQLTYNTNYHTINGTNIVTAIRNQNCTLNCNIDATWGAKSANSSFSITHSNQYTDNNSAHAVGYSDFYFCVTPPKLTTRKVITNNRVEKNDQFTIATTTGTTPVSSFTTAGSGSSFTTGTNSTTATGLSTTATYTIAETIANTDGKGDLAKYSTTYACTNANSSSTTMPSGSTTSFNLPTLTYGDDITCTITNTPNAYIFSGKVFNDTTVNGTIDSGESGIAGATINLTNCSGTNLGTTTTDSSGDYIFSFLANDTKITSLSKVCIVESNATGYTNDTTANNLTVTLLSGVKTYTGNNFGDNNTTGLLQLIKYQQVVACNTSDLVTLDSGFTTADLGVTTKVPSGSCIAYKIEATNLGNVPLTDVVITDSLMNDAKRISKIYTPPTPKLCISGTASTNCDTSKVTAPVDATTGTTKVTTSSFTIPGTGTAANKKASLYFNTLYSLK